VKVSFLLKISIHCPTAKWAFCHS